MAVIDSLTIGQKVSLRYAKDPNKLTEGYTGYVESLKGGVLTLRILNKGFRSFTISKIFGIVVE